MTNASPSFDGAFDVAVWSGKIVVGGGTGFYGSGASDFQVVRYNADGSLDSSFGGGGIVTTDFGGSDNIFGIAVTADGKITAAGGTTSLGDFAVARYNSDGSLDGAFGFVPFVPSMLWILGTSWFLFQQSEPLTAA